MARVAAGDFGFLIFTQAGHMVQQAYAQWNPISVRWGKLRQFSGS